MNNATTDAAAVNQYRDEITRLRARVRELSDRLQQMLDAIDSSNIDSPEIGGHDDIPLYRWHEEWAHHTRAALNTGEKG